MQKFLIKILLSFILTFNNANANNNAFDFNFEADNGKTINLADYKGKLILVINTPSLCGFNRDFLQLDQIAQDYQNRGLVIIAIPVEKQSHNFTTNMCVDSSTVNYFITKSIALHKGKHLEDHPFFKWAKTETPDDNNANKYLISPFGEIIASFNDTARVGSHEIIKKIEENLPPKQ
ncbi:MAG: redoxin domain-containing protein [Sphingobacteriia bacterium]|nr:redoxin domain-containing protein [Sphingobacteriia bacterium]